MRRNKLALCVLPILMCAVMYVAPIKVNAATVGYDSTCTYSRYNGAKYVNPTEHYWTPQTSPGEKGHWDYYGTCPDCGKNLHVRGGQRYERPEAVPLWHECYQTVSTTHSWSWVVDSYATCTSPQYGHYRCANCGNVTATQASGNALGHSWSWVVDSYATCTSPQYGHYRCANCGNVTARQASGNALGHSWSKWTVYQPATCTTNSKSRRSCSRCGAVENRENTNASLGPVAFGHKYKETARTYPDAVNPGSITFVCQNDPSHTVTNAITLGDWNIYFKERRVQKVALGDKLLNLLYVGDTPLRSYVENGVDPITGERNRVLH